MDVRGSVPGRSDMGRDGVGSGQDGRTQSLRARSPGAERTPSLRSFKVPSRLSLF